MNRTTIAIVCWLVIASTLLSACQIALPSGQTVPADLLSAMSMPQVNTATERATITSRSATDTAAGVTAEKSSPSAKAAAAPLPSKPSVLAPVNIPLMPKSATPLTASEVFKQISPAVVFVETPAATGSGVWIEPGYLVTNAHVVWPFNEVRIVFPNGEEHLDVPLIGWDLVADVAVLGPLETDVLPISFADGSELKIGSDIYLIGYPGEMEEFPQPTLTQGLLSRVRRWDTIDLDFFQVDAAIAGGQSGGVLVTGGGDVVGISTFFFTEAGFGLVASSANFVPRIESLINHGDIPTLTERRPFGSPGERQQTITLTGDDDARILMLPPGRADDIEITITGDGFPNFAVSSLYGYDYTEADISADGAYQTVEIAADMPYLVEVWHGSAFREKYELASSAPLIPLVDPDDDVVLTIGDTHLGNFDLPTDTDVYKIDLDEGDTIEVMADSLSIDPYLSISYETARRAATYEDDDSGGGIFGTNATLIFRAPIKDTYDIEVSSAYYGDEVGGYFLNIARAAEDAEVAEPTVERTFVASRYGKLERYKSDLTDFQILFPALWSETYDCSENATACYAGSIGTLAIIERRPGRFGHQ